MPLAAGGAPEWKPVRAGVRASASDRSRTASSLRKRIGSALAAVGALIAKFFAAIKGVLLLLPKVKLLTTAGTALVSVVPYSLFFGWWFAVGFVVLLFVHEMGHVIQLRREGIKASAPMFVPFLGAVVGSKQLRKNALAEARVGLAGPILGTAGAAVVPADRAADQQPAAAGAGVRRLLPEPDQPGARWSRSTAAGRWRRWRRGCGSWGWG